MKEHIMFRRWETCNHCWVSRNGSGGGTWKMSSRAMPANSSLIWRVMSIG